MRPSIANERELKLKTIKIEELIRSGKSVVVTCHSATERMYIERGLFQLLLQTFSLSLMRKVTYELKIDFRMPDDLIVPVMNCEMHTLNNRAKFVLN